jgi:hypothetical protein
MKARILGAALAAGLATSALALHDAEVMAAAALDAPERYVFVPNRNSATSR